MKPFAYQLLATSYGDLELSEVYPTLRAAVGRALERYHPTDTLYLRIVPSYPDGSGAEPINVQETFRIKVPVDKKAIRVEARKRIEEDAKAQAEWLNELRAQGRGPVTGSPWLCDYGEDEVVRQMIEERCWRWKTLEEVDWGAIELSLVKEDNL